MKRPARGTGEDRLAAALLRRTLVAARSVRRRAHAPYSRFLVGAAVLDEQGRVHAGCNVENASFGLTVCAERNAIAAAVAAGARRIVAVVVVTSARTPAAPCGACRQVISEFAAHGDIPIYLAPARGPLYAVLGLDDLLPGTFRLR